ncbi:MAG TPA: hypothetical protein PKN95_09170 [Verrucomicrobiota bacterium]|nr:hypothetical protein [Verrucomicrobiota bacterium]HNT14089.1 hypothetical protein [Verrucomicrobiota bacterium]
MKPTVFAPFRPWLVVVTMLGLSALVPAAGAAAPTFAAGREAYERGNYEAAAATYRQLAADAPAAGTFLNWGNAAWQLGHTTEALLAWERVLLISPHDARARHNLQFARETAQLEAPRWTWSEMAAAWLTARTWAWIACLSFWLAVSLAVLPLALSWRKTSWPQAGMALGLGVFLLSLPANYGTWTRTKIGFIAHADTALRLTPTADGEPVIRLAAGEPGRVLRTHSQYLLIETRLARGWVAREEFRRLIAPGLERQADAAQATSP